ncbi:MAG: NHL repeat-containing protein [Xanthomonadales bacterium]|nr:NHL repeat-containing protein [Xanthomonadales bacterium]
MLRKSRSKTPVFLSVLLFTVLVWMPLTQADSKKAPPISSMEKSDLNHDRAVDVYDLVMFSARYMQNHWTVLDWCAFYDATVTGLAFDSHAKKSKDNKNKSKAKPTVYYKKHFKMLLTFINDFYACDEDSQDDPDMLGIENAPKLLLRTAKATDGSGDIYITDPKVGSLFIYDSELVLKGELKDLDKPLGVAVDSLGYLLVGNDGRDNVEVFDPVNGNMVAIFGDGLVMMPNSISVGPDGNIYVTDSLNHSVRVFDADYSFIRSIGSPGKAENELSFPVDTEVITHIVDGSQVQEIYVADQGNKRIQIYDTGGNLLGRISQGRCGMMGCRPPVLANLHSLDIDSQGRLHALDNFSATVSMFDLASGAYLGAYGEYGEGPGFLGVPLGLAISDTDQSIVTSGDGSRIEVYSPQ